MKTSSAKQKGRKLQNIVRHKLIKLLGLNTDNVVSTPMGVNGVDIQVYGSDAKRFPFAIECKNQERLQLWQAIQQAEKNANDKVPLLIIKRNRSKIYAVIELDELLKYLR